MTHFHPPFNPSMTASSFQLSLSPAYCSDWGLWEGVREIVQNAFDAATDGHLYQISHDPAANTLTISTRGVRLDKRVWLFGTSSKADDTSGKYRGHFGEGLKLGVLCLTRAGFPLEIVNGDETWTPSLAHSEAFGDKVLTITTEPLPGDTGEFSITIGGITAFAWGDMRNKFLPLTPPVQAINTKDVQILADANQRKRVYVKGIFVNEVDSLVYGYDLADARTDRDRRMVSDYELCSHTSKAWAKAAAPDTISAMMDLILAGAADVKQLEYALRWGNAAPNAQALLTAEFRRRYGADAVPVTSNPEKDKATRCGRQAIGVPRAAMEALQLDDELHLERIENHHKTLIDQVIEPQMLTASERDNFEAAIAAIEAARPLIPGSMGELPSTSCVRIVSFRDPLVNGHYDGQGSTPVVSVARGCLNTFARALRVIGGNLCFGVADSNTAAHEQATAVLLSCAAQGLRDRSRSQSFSL
jgi:hypothetical protein